LTICPIVATPTIKKLVIKQHQLLQKKKTSKMSWQSYVDQLLGSEHITKAAIIGLDGNAWATSAGFSIPEGKALVTNFTQPAQAQANGVTVAGTKYLTVKADNRSIYGKKGAFGVVTVKTGKAVLVGVYDKEGIQPGNAVNTVEKLADYLIENGY